MSSRRDQLGLPPMRLGVAGYTIVRETEAAARKELERITDVKRSGAGYENFQQWLAGTQLGQALALEDYSVSNRGLRSGLVGTPERVAERVAFEAAGSRFVVCSSAVLNTRRWDDLLRPSLSPTPYS